MVIKNLKIRSNRVNECWCDMNVDGRKTSMTVFYDLGVIVVRYIKGSRILFLNDYDMFDGDMERFLEAKLETAPYYTGLDFLLPKQLGFLPYEYNG